MLKPVKTRVEETKALLVYAECECGGQFDPTGMELESFPVQYQHKCSGCGSHVAFWDRYPILARQP